MHFFFFNYIIIFFFLFISEKQTQILKWLYFIATVIVHFYCLILWYLFNNDTYALQFYFRCIPISIFQYGLDGLSLVFLLLTTFLFPLLAIILWSNKFHVKLMYFFLFLIEIFLILAFLTIDFLSFYIYFELILIPMIFIIGIWGTRFRKIKAIFYFFLYTFFGSLLMLFGLIIIYFYCGTTNFYFLDGLLWPFWLEKILWLLFFFSFAIKIPIFPFHIWLPEAHVEAPTFGSIILAALLLKLGGYGFLKILLPFFVKSSLYFLPLVFCLCFISILYSSLILLCQIDLKKIIAYSSIAHMNYAILGLFSQNYESIQGSVFLMLSHGFSSGALFFLVGFLYENYHSRLIFYYSGLIYIMPLFCLFFFFFSLANFGFPGTANFLGEFLIFINFYDMNRLLIYFLLFGLFLSIIYSILLYIRLFFGAIKLNYCFYFNYTDLKLKDFLFLLCFLFLLGFWGLYPNLLFYLVKYNIILFLIN